MKATRVEIVQLLLLFLQKKASNKGERVECNIYLYSVADSYDTIISKLKLNLDAIQIPQVVEHVAAAAPAAIFQYHLCITTPNPLQEHILPAHRGWDKVTT